MGGRVIVRMRLMLRVGNTVRRFLLNSARENDTHFRGQNAAAIRLLDLHSHLIKPESGRKPEEPFPGCACPDEGSEEHVATDACDRIENGKLSIRHRLTICREIG
jgi:hypothetical protein